MLPAAPYPAEGAEPVEGRLAWEFYFYDYQRRQRDVSISRVLKAIEPILSCGVPINERLPYFMFSLDVSGDLLAAGGSIRFTCTSAMLAARCRQGLLMPCRKPAFRWRTSTSFFDARRDLREAAEKIYSSAYVDATSIDIDQPALAGAARLPYHLRRQQARQRHGLLLGRQCRSVAVFPEEITVSGRDHRTREHASQQTGSLALRCGL